MTEQAAAQAAGGFNVWRSWDEPGGIRDELSASRAATRSSSSSRCSGRRIRARADRAQGHAGRARGAGRLAPGGAVLVDQHAREWISIEVNRRLLHHFIDRWRANDKEIKDLLKTTELWFVIVANPDGYQYTFDHERLWRKNLRDNDGDGEITVGDGVDPNRNFAEHWGYDNEGSSPTRPTRPTAGRAPPRSPRRGDGGPDRPHQAEVPVEPALVRPVAAVPAGLAGRDARRGQPDLRRARRHRRHPAIPGFNPGQSADTLYVTNGETTDYADTSAGTIAYTPELGEGSRARASCSRTTRR